MAKHQGKLIVGTVATLRQEKNIPRLIRAFTQATTQIDARLVIVGNGPEYQALWELVQNNNLSEKVSMLGHRDDPSEIVKAFDVFAISSDTEQMPISVLEAMAAGVPVIQPSHGSFPEMIDRTGGGISFAPNDAASLAESLTTLYQNTEMAADLGRRSAIGVQQHYSVARMAERAVEVYSSLV